MVLTLRLEVAAGKEIFVPKNSLCNCRDRAHYPVDFITTRIVKLCRGVFICDHEWTKRLHRRIRSAQSLRSERPSHASHVLRVAPSTRRVSLPARQAVFTPRFISTILQRIASLRCQGSGLVSFLDPSVRTRPWTPPAPAYKEHLINSRAQLRSIGKVEKRTPEPRTSLVTNRL